MRYYIDTEFIDDGKTIDLISIGLVCEDGREYYAQSCEFDADKASPWVQEHVFTSLLVCPRLSGNVRGLYAHAEGQCTFSDPSKGITGFHGRKVSGIGPLADCFWRTRKQLDYDVYNFIPVGAEPGKPELWGWCAGYDWVAFCQLFGTMMDLPRVWPHYIRDIQQVLDERGITDDLLPPPDGQAHNALTDARQIKKIWEMLYL